MAARRASRFRQSGQATVEWVGLMLGLALVFAALVAGGREATRAESADGLGEAVAERFTCAARGACRAGRATMPAAPGGLPGGRPSAPSEAPPRRAALPDGLRPLHGAAGIAKRVWIVCLGYRRWRYDVEHPLTPRQAVPVHETLKMVNECVNPLSFLFG